MQLFRGYVPTKDKQCLEKFKGRKRLNTLEEVQDLDEYAAILGDETILIDVDNAETSELLFHIVQDLGWRRNTSALTDTDVKYLLLYFEKNYELTSEKKIMAALSIVANENC